jgi:hypothetical protein
VPFGRNAGGVSFRRRIHWLTVLVCTRINSAKAFFVTVAVPILFVVVVPAVDIRQIRKISSTPKYLIWLTISRFVSLSRYTAVRKPPRAGWSFEGPVVVAVHQLAPNSASTSSRAISSSLIRLSARHDPDAAALPAFHRRLLPLWVLRPNGDGASRFARVVPARMHVFVLPLGGDRLGGREPCAGVKRSQSVAHQEQEPRAERPRRAVGAAGRSDHECPSRMQARKVSISASPAYQRAASDSSAPRFEPPDLWQTRFRDRAPRIKRFDGGDYIVVEADQTGWA